MHFWLSISLTGSRILLFIVQAIRAYPAFEMHEKNSSLSEVEKHLHLIETREKKPCRKISLSVSWSNLDLRLLVNTPRRQLEAKAIRSRFLKNRVRVLFGPCSYLTHAFSLSFFSFPFSIFTAHGQIISCRRMKIVVYFYGVKVFGWYCCDRKFFALVLFFYFISFFFFYLRMSHCPFHGAKPFRWLKL